MRKIKSGFNRRSTAEEVTAGLDLAGKTALITGVNSGLGYESMRVLASRGAHIIGAARTLEKASEACSQVGGDTTPVGIQRLFVGGPGLGEVLPRGMRLADFHVLVGHDPAVRALDELGHLLAELEGVFPVSQFLVYLFNGLDGFHIAAVRLGHLQEGLQGPVQETALAVIEPQIEKGP